MSAEDIDKSTQQVLDYYKKYSQNQNLPRFFSGTSVSYLPPIDTDIDYEQNEKHFDKRPAQSSAQSEYQNQLTNVPEIKIVIDEPKDITSDITEGSSNASSLDSPSAEHKKLEWDNGADIGYNSARNISELQLRKSSSLPIFDNLKEIKPNFIIPTQQPTSTSACTNNDTIEVLFFNSTISDPTKNSSAQTVSTSTTTSENTQNPSSSSTSSSNATGTNKSSSSSTKSSRSDKIKDSIKEFQKTLDLLKHNFSIPLGIPAAQSTPHVVSTGKSSSNATGTNKSNSSSTESSTSIRIKEFQKTLQYLKNNLGIPAAQSTPNIVSTENIAENLTPLTSKDHRQSGDERNDVVTPEVSTTKMHKSSTPLKKEIKKSRKTRIVELSITTPIQVNCSGLDLASSNKSATVQTEGFSRHDIKSQCDYKTKVVQQDQQVSTSKPNIISISEDSASSFEYIRVNKGRIQTQKSAVQKSSKEKPLETTLKEISSESGHDLRTEDIDRLMEAFHKLLRTKKMSSTTKKSCMKKIFKEFCQIESSNNSTTSSDLFFPKKEKPLSDKVDSKHSHKSSSESRSLTESECQKCIEEIESVIKVSPSDSEPEKSKSTKRRAPEDETSTSKNLYAIASSSGSTQPPASAQLYTFPKTLESKSVSGHLREKLGPEPGIRQDQVVPDDIKTSRANYKESETISEKRIATASTSQPQSGSELLSNKCSDDYLLTFVEEERNDHLNRINSEINHLSKIKSILEKKNNKYTKTKTNVYNIAEKHGSLERNYVIQTDVVPQDQDVNSYVINGKEYVVSGSGKSSSNSDKAFKADIEYNYGEYETNIKIRTICNICKQIKCCCSKATLHSKLSSLKTDSSLCLYCQQSVCCCEKRESIEDKNVVAAKISPQIPDESQEIHSSCQLVDSKKQKDLLKDKNFGSSAIASTKSAHMVAEEPINSEDDSSKSSSHSYVSFSDTSNSLKTVFKNCKCTIADNSCSCFFVKKLIGRFQMPQGQQHKEPKPSTSETLNLLYKDERSSSKSSRVEDLSAVTSSYKSTQTNNIVFKTTHTEISSKTAPKRDKETFTSTEQMEQEINVGLPKISEEFEDNEKGTMTYETQPYSGPPKHPGTYRHIGTQVFPNFETAKSSIAKLHKNVQVQVDKALESHLYKKSSEKVGKNCITEFQAAQVGPEKNGDNLSTESANIEDKGSGEMDKGICSKCKKSRSESASKKSSLTKPRSKNTSSDTTSDSKSSASSRITCHCCKQKAFLGEVSYLQANNDFLPFCSRCYYKRPRHCHHDPKYMCQCRSYDQNEQNSDRIHFCKCCRLDITKCPRRPKSIAYTLTLRDDNVKERRKSSKSSLENIKVQKGWSRKSFKNQENYHKQYDDRTNSSEKERPKETEKNESDRPKRKKPSRSNLDVGESNRTKEDEARPKRNKTSISNLDVGETKSRKKEEDRYTLMEYLIQNRPQFIFSAEYRRQMLLNSRISRERQRDAVKINFLDNNSRRSKNGNYKLFTEKEMRDINKKNYQKLPEVQGRLINQRESQLRQADRLISHMLAKKVQKSVLKGKGSFPIDKPLTN